MSHLLREHAPITEAGWELLDDEARERLTPGARRPQAGRLRRAPRLGALGDEPRPHEDARRGARRRRRRPRSAACCRWSSCGREFSVARSELDDADRGAEDVDFDDLDEAARRIASAENAAVFHGWEAAGITGIAEASPHARDRARRGLRALPAPRRHGGRRAAATPASTGPTGSRSGPTRYTRVLETSEHGGYPLLDHLRKILGGPIVWAPGRATARSS